MEGATILVLDTQRRPVAEVTTDSEGKATVKPPAHNNRTVCQVGVGTR